MLKIFTIFVALFLNQQLLAWDGYDWESGESIAIESGNLVRSGNDIEVYNWNTGEYKTYEVDSVSSGEVEVYDYDSGEYKKFDMD